MRVTITFDFSDAERARLMEYEKVVLEKKGLPRLARREDLRNFVHGAISNAWMTLDEQVDDQKERIRQRDEED